MELGFVSGLPLVFKLKVTWRPNPIRFWIPLEVMLHHRRKTMLFFYKSLALFLIIQFIFHFCLSFLLNDYRSILARLKNRFQIKHTFKESRVACIIEHFYFRCCLPVDHRLRDACRARRPIHVIDRLYLQEKLG